MHSLLYGKNKHKGETATILIIAGSKKYSGAPVLATIGAFRSGAEMVFVMVPEGKETRNNVRRVYEAIVSKLHYNTRILNKITACVIGPGLGHIKSKHVEIIKEIVAYLDERNVYTILDADAIHLYKLNVFDIFNHIILTPNHNERKNLIVKNDHFCLCKGHEDEIYKGTRLLIKVTMEKSISKRACGIGDLLTGVLASFLSILDEKTENSLHLACRAVKLAILKSFNKNGYSIMATDIAESFIYVIFDMLDFYL